MRSRNRIVPVRKYCTKVVLLIIDYVRLKMPSPMQTALIWVGFVVFVLFASRVTYYLLGWYNERRLKEKAEIYQRLINSWGKEGKKKSNSLAKNVSGDAREIHAYFR
jgi:archaellum biogenesis protein FlaJ (TadC family)